MACKISIHRKMRAQRQKIWQEVLLHILEDTTTMQALIRSIKASQKEGGGAAIMLTTLCTFMADNVWHVPFKKLWYLMRISTRASSFHHHQQQQYYSIIRLSKSQRSQTCFKSCFIGLRQDPSWQITLRQRSVYAGMTC